MKQFYGVEPKAFMAWAAGFVFIGLEIGTPFHMAVHFVTFGLIYLVLFAVNRGGGK